MAINNNIVNSFTEVQEALLSVLNNNAAFDKCGVKILAEDSKELEFEIKEAIGKQGIVATVTTPRVSYSGQYARNTGISNPSTLPYWTIDEINVIVAEQPTINRARAKEGKTIKNVELTCFYEGTTGEEGAKREYRRYIVPKRSNFETTSLSNTLSSFEGGIMQIVDSANPEFPNMAFCSLQCHQWGDVYAGFEYQKESGNDYFELTNTDNVGVTMTEYEDFYIVEPERDAEDTLIYPDAWADSSVFKCYTLNISSNIVPPTYAMTAMDAALQAANTLVELNSVVPIDISQTVEDGLVFATVRLKSNIIFLYNKTYITN